MRALSLDEGHAALQLAEPNLMLLCLHPPGVVSESREDGRDGENCK